MNITDLRREYTLAGIRDGELDPDPIVQFRSWFDEAIKAEVVDANAFTLSTVTPQGLPASRVVLLKDFDAQGFVFFTNYESDKAADLEHQPVGAMNFYWGQLERQVRVVGPAVRVSEAESLEYFRTRPRGSQLAAWASRQSHPIPSRKILENHLREFEMEHDEQDHIPMPPWWGGYRIQPLSYEFWQGRPNRLHDRFRYTRAQTPDDDTGSGWKIERLSP